MKKENIPLLIGLLIPVLMVLVLAAIIFLPRLYANPQYDFVYAVGDYPTHINTVDHTQTEYRVVNGTFSVTTTPYEHEHLPHDTTNQPEFYRYDVSEHTNTLLSIEELQTLKFHSSTTSPDGFTVNNPRSRDNFFESIFGGRDYSRQVLEKGTVAIPLETVNTGEHYLYQHNFLGWIIPQ